MKTFYVYGNSDQMYEMLINNSIYAKRETPVDMQASTAGFLSENFIFASSKELSDEIRTSGCTESFRPCIAEIEFDETSSAPVLAVMKSQDGSLRLDTEWKKVSEVPNDDILGIFIPGEVPISYLKRILFISENDLSNFPRVSDDLWFPVCLFGILANRPERSSLTLDDIRKVSEEADAFMSEGEADRIFHLVEVRNRRKAAYYYTIEATKSWKEGPVSANIDSYLLSILNDEGGRLSEKCRESFQKGVDDKNLSFDDYCLKKDPVLEDSETLEGKLFRIIIEVMEEQTPVGQNLNDDLFDEIGKRYMYSLSSKEAKDAAGPLHIVQMFLDESIMDPDEALEKLKNFTFFKAFMLYWFYRNNADYMRNSSVKLDQYGKRYEYIMLGTAGGMEQVDGTEKSRRRIEYALEQRILKEFADEHLISAVNKEENSSFLKDTLETDTFIPTFKAESAEKDILKRLENCKDQALLEKFYKKIKSELPKNKDFYNLVKPVEISAVAGGEVIGKYIIRKKSEAKFGTSKLGKLIKSMQETFDEEAFRKYVTDKTRFAEIYKKHEADLKELLGDK